MGNYFRKNRKILPILLGASSLALVITLIFIFNATSSLSSQSKLIEGSRVCFSRVGQVFSARAMENLNSNYLTKEFYKDTERCYSESIDIAKTLKNSELLEKLNNLATETHWFHERVKQFGSQNLQKTVSLESINEKFNELETLNNSLVDHIEYISNDLIRSLRIQKIVGICSFLLLLSIVSYFGFYVRGRDESNSQLEEMAKIELAKDKIQPLEIQKIIGTALGKNELSFCQELFYNYHYSHYRQKNKVVQTKKETKKVEIRPENIVQSNQQKEKIILSVNVDDVLTKVITVLKEKIFIEGVILEIDIDQDIYVHANEEDLEHILYQLLMHSINSCGNVFGKKRISFNLKKLGGTILLNIEDNGVGFAPEFIHSYVHGKQINSNELGIELQICSELLKQSDGEIAFANILDESGMIVGGEVKLLFRRAQKISSIDTDIIEDKLNDETSQPQLVKLVRGKKKDLVNSL